MSTWNIATVSAPSSRNMPATLRNVNAISSAEVVMRLARTTPAPDAIVAMVRTAKSAGSMKLYTLCRRPQPLAERDKATALDVRQGDDEEGEKDPVGDRHRHHGRREDQQQDRRHHQIRERQRDQDLPAERHELVDAQPRKRRADPHEHEHEEVGLEREPEHPEEREDLDERAMPRSEPQRRDDRRHDRDLAV